jgi:hypothetical protein
MASDKRERQRQNRAVKQEAEGKVARKQKTIDLTKRVAIWVAVGVVLILLANVVWG